MIIAINVQTMHAQDTIACDAAADTHLAFLGVFVAVCLTAVERDVAEGGAAAVDCVARHTLAIGVARLLAVAENAV